MRVTSMVLVTAAASAMGILGGCYAQRDSIAFHRTQAPALSDGCPVNRIASDTAPYAVEDLVTVTVRYLPGGRDRTMHKIDTDACYYGGDTVYKIKEEALNGVATLVTATIARKIGASATISAVAPPPATPAAPATSATVGPAIPGAASAKP